MSHRIVSENEWIAARKRHLVKEKEFTRLYDELTRQRRELPWVRVEKNYLFDGPKGTQTLADLFAGRSQLIVQHFMFGPGWKEGCVGCSFQADHVDSAWVHLAHHDVSFAAVSRAPFAQIEPFRQRMGWRFHWVSSYGSDFNYDYQVSFTQQALANGATSYNFEARELDSEEMPGISVFFREAGGEIFRTYSSYGRGDEQLIGAYSYLDLTPRGRNETGPSFDLTDWVRHHDKYEQRTSSCCGGGK